MKTDGSGRESTQDVCLIFVLHSDVICVYCSVIVDGWTSVIQSRDCRVSPTVLCLP